MSDQRKSASGIVPSIIVSAIISLAIAGALFFIVGAKAPKIAYIDTGKLLVGFSAANEVEKEVKVEDDKWQAELKILQNSLQAT
ncbi:MAG: OmpH family outer membrane protein [Chitinispirillaceae bacterium]|jgi:Skp family chaperone for outer membrane proteins